ncbi:MAG: beta-ketoacyl-[acyl-carrier-protein] synthase family protein [Steroidobacteraceae bacterium]
MARIASLRVTACTLTSAAGAGRAATLEALRSCQSGLRTNDFGPSPLPTWVGRVGGIESTVIPVELRRWDSRNNRLAWLGLETDGFLEEVRSARLRHGPERIAVVMGTSTASIGGTEEAYRRLGPQGEFPPELATPAIHNPHSVGGFVQQALQLEGPCVTVATACSSSAKVFAQAERMIRLGLVDAAVVGGVDSLCGSVLYGFNSLELISPEPCRPFDCGRRGINIGEAAGFALLERDGRTGPWLRGYGESSDAHHMSSPHPEGHGARIAILGALHRAGLAPDDVEYVNLHGTASVKNDEVEAALVADLFPDTTLASSTKGWTGHTLGAAGIVEAAIAMLAIGHDLVPGTLNCTSPDPVCGPQIMTANVERRVDVALSFSFGFGGSNCVLAFSRDPE